MSKCLVTTLQESVDDAKLSKLGDLKFSFNSDSVGNFVVQTFSNVCTAKLSGSSHFTNKDGTQNLGNVVQIPSDTYKALYVSPGECEITISDKYNIRDFTMTTESNAKKFAVDQDSIDGMNSLINLGVGINSVWTIEKLAKKSGYYYAIALFGENLVIGDIGVLVDKNLSYFCITNQKQLTGDINVFGNMSSLEELIIYTCRSLTGNINALSGLEHLRTMNLTNDKGLIGDISRLAVMPALVFAYLAYTNVSGNLSSISTKTNLRVLALDGTNVTGDTSSLANLTNLTTFTYANTAITGSWPLT